MSRFPILELTDDLYCVLDEQYCINDVNQRWTEVLGYTQIETIGKPFSHFCHVRKSNDLIPDDVIKLHFSSNNGRLPDLKFITNDGGVRHFRWKFKKVNEHFHLLGQQITDEVKYKDVLEVIENQLKVGYWRLNLAEMKLWWSDQTFRIHELPLGTIPSLEDALRFYGSDGTNAIKTAVENCIKDGKRYDLELPFVTAKGNSIWVRTTGQAIFDQGRAIELFGIFEDITNRKKIGLEQISIMESSYQNERLTSMGELAAGVGHEINNPLTIAMGNVDFIKRHLIANKHFVPELEKHFERFERATSRISKIIASLRSLAKETQHSEYEPLDINDLIRDSLAIVIEIYKKQHGIKINFELCPSLALVQVNRSRICHVLTNLLSNAKDAIENQSDKQINIKTEKKESLILISVSDNGEGIPLNIRSKVFDPFFTTKDPNRGTGIGLSVSANIINEHGGRLYVNAQATHTEFCIEIPIAKRIDLPITA